MIIEKKGSNVLLKFILVGMFSMQYRYEAYKNGLEKAAPL